jgi:hypothetical protein
MKKILINGAPRSGTSWLGQIFNSNTKTVFRFQPLFSYSLKGYLNSDSSKQKIDNFYEECLSTTDDFILQKNQEKRGVHTIFQKNNVPTHLVLKHVRYHNIVENILRQTKNTRCVFVIRNPCGAINSWLKTPREFNPQWNKSEFLFGDFKNRGREEEFYGFLKWKESAQIFLNLHNSFPQRTKIISYEKLCKNRIIETKQIFDFCELDLETQTLEFLNFCQSKNIDDPDTVFRKANNCDLWRTELDSEIREFIFKDLQKTNLDVFLEQ